MDSHFRCLLNFFDYKAAVFRIDYKHKDFPNLREAFTQFHPRNVGFSIKAWEKHDELI